MRSSITAVLGTHHYRRRQFLPYEKFDLFAHFFHAESYFLRIRTVAEVSVPKLVASKISYRSPNSRTMAAGRRSNKSLIFAAICPSVIFTFEVPFVLT